MFIYISVFNTLLQERGGLLALCQFTIIALSVNSDVSHFSHPCQFPTALLHHYAMKPCTRTQLAYLRTHRIATDLFYHSIPLFQRLFIELIFQSTSLRLLSGRSKRMRFFIRLDRPYKYSSQLSAREIPGADTLVKAYLLCLAQAHITSLLRQMTVV